MPSPPSLRLPRVTGVVLAAFMTLVATLPAWAQNDPDPAFGAAGPQLTFHGFSDVTFWAQRDRPDGGTDSSWNGFVMGQFDLYFVSRLGDNLSFLGETVFEFNEAGEGVVDVERVLMKYAYSDMASLSVGRMHTALGYWNEAYHHGRLLQPTVDRPEALKFEDDGGILPVHAVGLELSGRAGSGARGLNYVANFANGRGPIPDEVQGGGDLNRLKAMGLKLTFVSDGSVQLQLGGAFYKDRIPADPFTPGLEGEIDEQIPGAHLYLLARDIMVIAEYFHVRHEDLGSGAVWDHDAGYAVAIRNSGRWRPYAGFDRVDHAEDDLFYGDNNVDVSRAIAGTRIEFGSFNCVKIEYRHDWHPAEESDALLVQTAFTF